MTAETRAFAITHLRMKRDNLVHDAKRFQRLAAETKRDSERYEQATIKATEQIESIDALLAEVGEVID